MADDTIALPGGLRFASAYFAWSKCPRMDLVGPDGRPFGPPWLEDDARAFAAAINGEIARLKRELAETRAALNETWDDGETVWTRPTAWAYAQACKVINERKLAAENRADLAETRAGAVLPAELMALREALKPSGDTKAAYIGELYVDVPTFDIHGDEHKTPMALPWTTIKDVMAMISARAERTLAARQPGAAQAPAEGWRDISTAPRDGTYVLTANERRGIATANCFGNGLWSAWEENAQPTHWMPLPPAPATQESAR